MASVIMTQDGAKTAIKVYVDVSEEAVVGNFRRLHMTVMAYPEDDHGHLDRDGYWSFSFLEEDIDDSGSEIINNSGMCLYDGYPEVYVEPGTTTASVNISFSATLKSPSAGNRTVNGRISAITGLSLIADTVIATAKDIYFGDKCNITWIPASSSFTYRLQFSLGKFSYTTDLLKPESTDDYTYSDLVIPETEAVNIPDSEYGTVAVSLMQYSDSSGTKLIGASSTKSFKITLKENIIPKITSHSVSIDNSANDVVNQWNIALTGYTKVRINAEASGVYGSTIKSFSISGDYKANVNDIKLDYIGKVISKSGNKSFIITCVDTRGRVSEQVITDPITFLPYVQPKVIKLSMKKEDNGDDDTTNDRMIATATWTYDLVDNHNSATGKIYYKISTADDWTEHSGVIVNNEPFVLSDLRLHDSLSYNFKVVVTDAIGNMSSKEAFSSTIRVLMDYQSGGMGLGIGKVCEIDNIGLGTQSLEVSMDSYFFGEVYVKDKTQTLENYIKKVTKYLVADEDYGDEHPAEIIQNPQIGQIYYMKISGE